MGLQTRFLPDPPLQRAQFPHKLAADTATHGREQKRPLRQMGPINEVYFPVLAEKMKKSGERW